MQISSGKIPQPALLKQWETGAKTRPEPGPDDQLTLHCESVAQLTDPNRAPALTKVAAASGVEGQSVEANLGSCFHTGMKVATSILGGPSAFVQLCFEDGKYIANLNLPGEERAIPLQDYDPFGGEDTRWGAYLPDGRHLLLDKEPGKGLHMAVEHPDTHSIEAKFNLEGKVEDLSIYTGHGDLGWQENGLRVQTWAPGHSASATPQGVRASVWHSRDHSPTRELPDRDWVPVSLMHELAASRDRNLQQLGIDGYLIS